MQLKKAAPVIGTVFKQGFIKERRGIPEPVSRGHDPLVPAIREEMGMEPRPQELSAPQGRKGHEREVASAYGKLGEMGEYSVKIRMPVDEDGFFGRECQDNCFEYFKVQDADFTEFEEDAMWCPYCGHRGEHGSFLTSAQLEYVKSAAMKAVILAFAAKDAEIIQVANELFKLGSTHQCANLDLV